MSGSTTASAVDGSRFLRGHIARELAAVVGADHISIDAHVLQEQAADWSWSSKYLTYRELEQPEADFAVWPGTTGEVERVVQIASDYGIPIVTRGGGSGTRAAFSPPTAGSASTSDASTRSSRSTRRASSSPSSPVSMDRRSRRSSTRRGSPSLTIPGRTTSERPSVGFVAARGSGVVSTKYGKAEDQVVQLEVVVPPGRTDRDPAGAEPCRRSRPAPDVRRLGGHARSDHASLAPRRSSARDTRIPLRSASPTSSWVWRRGAAS